MATVQQGMTNQDDYQFPETRWRGKSWGTVKTLSPGVDILRVNIDESSSVHLHRFHANRFHVLFGTFRITEFLEGGEASIVLESGDSWTVMPGRLHMFKCLSSGHLLECYIRLEDGKEPEWSVEDDIERIETD